MQFLLRRVDQLEDVVAQQEDAVERNGRLEAELTNLVTEKARAKGMNSRWKDTWNKDKERFLLQHIQKLELQLKAKGQSVEVFDEDKATPAFQLSRAALELEDEFITLDPSSNPPMVAYKGLSYRVDWIGEGPSRYLTNPMRFKSVDPTLGGTVVLADGYSFANPQLIMQNSFAMVHAQRHGLAHQHTQHGLCDGFS